MGSQATCVYKVVADGAAQAAISTAMQAAPLPVDLLQLYGLRVLSDTPTVAATCLRTIVFGFNPSVTALAHTTLFTGDPSGSPVNAVIIDNAGNDYIVPPGVSIAAPSNGVQAKGVAFLNVQAGAVDAGGAAYSGTTFASVIGGMAPPKRDKSGAFNPTACVQRLNLNDVGRGYSASTKVQFQGGLPNGTGTEAEGVCTVAANGRITSVTLTKPGAGYVTAPKVFFYDPTNRGSGAKVSATMGGGTPATLTLTIVANAITAVAVTTRGTGYVAVPDVLIVDPTAAGSGAAIHLRMGVERVDLLNRGSGYTAAPLLTFIPRFKTLFPDGSDQKKPFYRLLEPAIALTLPSPVVSAAPVIA